MPNLAQLIESVVSEVLKEVNPEAPTDAPFGQYLFARDRKDLSPEEKREENTELEDEFRDALFEHYQGDSRKLGKLANEIQGMVDKGWYTKILAAPDELMYRWISNVDMGVAAKMLNVAIEDLEEEAGWVGKYNSGVMIPGGPQGGPYGIHSWSTQLDEKWILADLHPYPLEPGQTAMILVARTSGQNFFINPNNIGNVGRLPRYAYYQNEVISHGPIKFETAWVLSNSNHSTEAIKGNDVLFQLIESAE